jgi:hypothetical protein
MANERYALYGVIAEERDVNKVEDFAKQAAEDSGEVLIYETDDPTEAREIYEAGGFSREGVWHAVTRAVDRNRHPESAPSAATHSLVQKPQSKMPQKPQ